MARSAMHPSLFLNTSRDGDSNTSLCSPFHTKQPFSLKNFFTSNVQLKPPVAQLQTVSSCPVPGCLGEKADPRLAATPFQAAAERASTVN